MPMIAQILPVFTLLYEDSVYNSGLALYKANSFLAITKAMIPVMKQITIDKIHSTKTAVALGSGCCGLGC